MRIIKAIYLSLLLTIPLDGSVVAQSSSTNYRIDESAFSSGSGTGSSSNFSSRGSAGDLGIGLSESANFSVFAGPISPDEEYLELNVSTTTVDLGTLSELSTGSGTASFYVRTYINESYAVYTLSSTLTSESGATIDPISTPTASTQGTEQFGMNLVANTIPAIGADPSPIPSATYANGMAATDYNTPDLYKYGVGDIVARSGSAGFSWGRTDFTISYIANINKITEAGNYETVQDLVLTATY